MSNGELLVSGETLNRIFVLLLYVPVCLISYWQLIPRLSPTSRRIASGFLAAQVLVIVLSLEIQTTSEFEEWRWNLDQVWSTLAAMQMALVGIVALVTAWLARARPAWQRLYLVGIGLVFPYLGLDDFFDWKGLVESWWKEPYTLVGAVVVAATLAVAMRSPRHARIWHLCLPTGLSLMAMGGFLVDDFPAICGHLGFLHIDGCLQFRLLEEALEFLGAWLILVAMLGHFSNTALTPKPHIRLILYAMPVLWIPLFLLNPLIPRLEAQQLAQPASVQFESGVHLHGYRIDTKKATSYLLFYVSATQQDYIGLGYSIHLVDRVSGESIASRNEYADRHIGLLLPTSYVYLYRHQMEINIPPQTPVNRALWVVLTLWRKKSDEFERQEVIASDHQLLDETHIVLDELVVPALSAAQGSKEAINNYEFTISSEKLIIIFLFLLYVPIGLISYRWLIPRLAVSSAGLASVMLVAQILVIVLSIGTRLTSDFEKWLWNLDQEWNIPSTLASTQLALVAGVALVTAWLAQARPIWQRLYLVGIGLIFLFLARDEYFTFHEHIANWERYYAALGAVVAVATAVVAVRSPRRAWIWHLCLLIGLVISAIGAMSFEANRRICGSWGFLPIDGCLWSYNYGESLEFLGIWLALVAMLGHFSDTVPTPKLRVRRALYTFPVLWILLLIRGSFTPSLELRLLAQPASVQFESEVQLYGYRIESSDSAALLHLYVSAERHDYLGLGYSIHLVDQVSGESVASRNEYADRQVGLLFAPGQAHVYRQWMELEIPPQAPVNRAFWIVLTLWRKKGDEFVRQPILASDLQLLDDTQVVLDELVVPTLSAVTPPTVPLAVFDNGFTLDAVDLPQRIQPGETLTIHFNWRSDSDGQEDYVQFLHFGHQESGAWWVYDQQPLGPRLPTRLWYNGLADSEAWQVPLPADLTPGRYTIFTGLYRRHDLERVPVSSADGTPWLDARVLLSSLTIGGA